MVAMVGKTRAPHRIRVADTWSAKGLASAGIRGTGQPIPAHTQVLVLFLRKPEGAAADTVEFQRLRIDLFICFVAVMK